MRLISKEIDVQIIIKIVENIPNTWRRSHIRNFIDLIVRVIKSRRLRWAGQVARMEESRSDFKILTSEFTGKRPLGRPRRRWEDNIRMDLK